VVHLPANSLAVRAPSTQHAQLRVGIRRLAAPAHLAHVRVSARVLASEHLGPALALGQALAVRRRPVKHRARNALPRVAAAEASSSIPRLKKAR